MEISKMHPLDQDWLDKVSREDEEWDPNAPENVWPDKSQDVDWLRGHFLARGVEIEALEQRIYRLTAAYTAHEIALEGALLHKAWYRAAFGITVGVLIVRLFT